MNSGLLDYNVMQIGKIQTFQKMYHFYLLGQRVSQAGSLLVLFFDPENGGGLSLQTSGYFKQYGMK
jgi:hypothetical protein